MGANSLRDQYGRTVDYLRLSVTDLCNYRCQYCMGPQGVEKRPRGAMLSVEECVEIGAAAVACGVKKIRLTGGEPLVRRGLLDICRGLRALPGLEELCLTTNGSLLPNLAGPLRKAGVDRLNISLDTLRPDRFAAMTRLGRLEDALSGIRAAEDAGFTNLKLDTVLIGGFNDDEIKDFLALTMDHPWEVRFIELMPMGPCAQWENSCFLPVEHILKNNPALQILSTEGVARRYRLPQALGTVGLISPVRRTAEGLSPQPGGTAPAGASRRGSAISHSGGHCPKALPAPPGGPPQRHPQNHEPDWRLNHAGADTF